MAVRAPLTVVRQCLRRKASRMIGGIRITPIVRQETVVVGTPDGPFCSASVRAVALGVRQGGKVRIVRLEIAENRPVAIHLG